MWKPVQNRAPDLFNFIENFSFDWGEYVALLELYTRLAGAGRAGEQLIRQVACAWLNHLIELPDGAQQPWAHNFPVTVRNQLYIGEDKYIIILYIFGDQQILLGSQTDGVNG